MVINQSERGGIDRTTKTDADGTCRNFTNKKDTILECDQFARMRVGFVSWVALLIRLYFLLIFIYICNYPVIRS